MLHKVFVIIFVSILYQLPNIRLTRFLSIIQNHDLYTDKQKIQTTLTRSFSVHNHCAFFAMVLNINSEIDKIR